MSARNEPTLCSFVRLSVSGERVILERLPSDVGNVQRGVTSAVRTVLGNAGVVSAAAPHIGYVWHAAWFGSAWGDPVHMLI